MIILTFFSFIFPFQDLYLVPPYVDGKGVSTLANIYSEYSILSHGEDQHIKLGYMSPDTAGALMYRKPMGQDNFMLQVKVQIEELKKGDQGHGILIFLNKSDKVEIGSFYGIKNCEFGVALDTKNGMDVDVKTIINNKVVETRKFRFFEEDDVTVIIKQDDKLVVELDDTYEKLLASKSEVGLLNKSYFLGISASNGNSSSASFILKSIQPSNIVVVPKIFKRGEREGSSKVIWLVFVLGSGGLVYYLYLKQVKKEK